MSIKAVISEVLKKRHQNVPMLEQTERELLELSRQLDALRSMASETADGANVPPDFRDATANIANQVGNLQQDITELLPKVANVTERFRKDTVNICMAGKAKQGKSTILQRISGLPKEFIPTKENEACTGTKSKIYHIEGEPYARIDFYAADEFLKEMVAPSFKRLRLPAPFSLREFQNPLPPLKSEGDEILLDKEVYAQLENVHRAFPAFQQELSTSKTIQITDIPKYVTKEDDISIGIKTAHISTRFPNHDVTGLCLIDLPGMEAGQNFEEKLIASLEKEVDAVIYVKRPNPQEGIWDKTDYNILDMINRTVKDIQLEQWLFIVLNEHENGANTGAVQFLKDHPPANYTGLKMLTCMCKNSENVERDIFAPILRHLEQNLEKIDRVILESLSRSVEQVVSKLNAMAMPIFSILRPGEVDIETQNKFDELFEEFMENLTSQLENLVKSVHETAYLTTIQTNFLEKVRDVCDKVEQAPPVASPDELKRRAVRKRGWNTVVEEELNYLRSYLAKYLAAGLDAYLENMVEGVYKEVLIKILPPSLRRLLSLQDVERDSRFILEEFYKSLDPKWQQKLINGFRYMLDFTFSYHSHFHHRVRQEMKPLDPMAYACSKEIVPEDFSEHTDEENADTIRCGLETKFKEALYQVRKRFTEEMRNDPSNAIFSLVEEIRDRLAFEKGIDREWRNYLWIHKGQVWPEEFGKIEREIERQQRWQTALTELISKGKSAALKG